MSRRNYFYRRLKRFRKTLGPGLITGASDDDPSAITTFSQAGAQYGLSTLWMAPFAFPVLAVLQEMCARIGIVTGKGLTGVIKTHYPKWILYLLIAFCCPAFLLNIGADIAVLGETGSLLFPSIPPLFCSMGFTAILFVLILILPYKKLARIMKYICISLLVYIIVPFLSPQNIRSILRHTLVPTFRFDKDFIQMVTGITGAIISPYLFFWQTSSEVEAMETADTGQKSIHTYTFRLVREDILAGAFFAVLIMYFIILTTGTILNTPQITHINTIKDAALALQPLAGERSYVLFSIGIIGTGLLIIPVLSASISYILTEAFNRQSGFNKTPGEARLFYVIIAIAMCFGIGMHRLHINAVKALLLTTLLYGIMAPFLTGIILHISNSNKIMGAARNNVFSNIVGSVALILMLSTVLALVYFLIPGLH